MGRVSVGDQSLGESVREQAQKQGKRVFLLVFTMAWPPVQWDCSTYNFSLTKLTILCSTPWFFSRALVPVLPHPLSPA